MQIEASVRLAANRTAVIDEVTRFLKSQNVDVSKPIMMGPTTTIAYDWEGIDFEVNGSSKGEDVIPLFLGDEATVSHVQIAVKQDIAVVQFTYHGAMVSINLSAATVTAIDG